MKAVDFGYAMRSIMYNVNGFIGSKTDAFGMKQGQFEYFLLIVTQPGINQLELGKMKHVGRASVTKALKILEADGFIRREVDEKDRRNIRCYVAERGEAIAEELFSVRSNVEKQLFDGFSDEDKMVLYGFLQRLQKNAEGLKDNTKRRLK